MKLIEKFWWQLSLLIMISITAFSLWPADSLPQVPGTDKTHHFIAYALLVLPTALKQPKYWRVIALAFIAFSGLIELIQPYVNRYGEWLDLLANTVGIGCGIVLGMLCRHFASQPRK